MPSKFSKRRKRKDKLKKLARLKFRNVNKKCYSGVNRKEKERLMRKTGISKSEKLSKRKMESKGEEGSGGRKNRIRGIESQCCKVRRVNKNVMQE